MAPDGNASSDQLTPDTGGQAIPIPAVRTDSFEWRKRTWASEPQWPAEPPRVPPLSGVAHLLFGAFLLVCTTAVIVLAVQLAAEPASQPEDGRILTFAMVAASVSSIALLLVNEMKSGHAVTITPLSQRISTQEAADLLGLSRPTLVKLLETGEIAYEQPGRHRRVLLTDVLNYREEKHRAAMNTLDTLTADASAAGLYATSSDDYKEALRKARAKKPRAKAK